MYGVLINHDEEVANWIFRENNLLPLPVARAIGVMKDGKLVGGAYFYFYNGFDAHLSYYGKETVTLGIVRFLATVAIVDLGLSRVTLTVRKKSKRLTKSLLKLGFKLEGTQRCFFGARDCNYNTALRLVMFKEGLQRLVGDNSDKVAARC